MSQSLKNILQTALILGLCFSCATPPKQTKETYSQSTDDEFQDIERERALETYRLLRLRDREQNQNRSSSRRSYKRIKPRQEIVNRPPPPPPKPKPLSEEKITEIKQNLIYFCMKNRKHPKFSDEEHCQNHAQAKFDECKESYEKNPGLNVVRCVKNKLNL
ncbi:MAG: hypothetical protein EP326_15935 [Deltaproteobacteria bacterium]|nr:MAG: hypothetical protein EP326_15935 [Deltaproteobacteria bacterium]TNF26672.1 MAG: hypothetical protein EP319_13240 [Deltaproteobacteria bacterium]